MIDDLATEELSRLGRDNEDPDILLTLTAGGNDLLDALATGRRMEAAVSLAVRRYTDLVETVREELPRATLVLTAVYDPTDGTGRLPGLESHGRLPIEQLDRFNRQIGELAQITEVNGALSSNPALVNSGATGDGWLWKMKLADPSQLSGLMDEAAYKKTIG